MADTSASSRSRLILFLFVLVALQAALIVFLLALREPVPMPSEPGPNATVEMSQAGPKSGEGAQVVAVAVDGRERKGFLVAFDSPVGPETPGEAPGEPPATVDPALKGRWTWLTPYLLRFTTENALETDKQYTVTLSPVAFAARGKPLTGQLAHTVRTEPFEVTRFDAEMAAVPGSPGMVAVKGRIAFSTWVDPAKLGAAMVLADPAAKGEAVGFTIRPSWQAREFTFVSGPLSRAGEPREVAVSVNATLTPASGTVTLGEPVSRAVRIAFDPNLKVMGLTADSTQGGTSIRLRFSTPVAADEAKRFVTLSPETGFRLAADGQELLLSGDIKPGAAYTVAVAKGLRAEDGAVLPAPYRQQVTTPDLPPSVGFESQGMFLSRKGLKTLALTSVNVQSAQVAVDRVYPNNLFALFGFNSWMALRDEYYQDSLSRALGDRLAETHLPLGGEPNRKAVTPLRLDSLVPVDKPGLYRVSVVMPGSYSGMQRWVMVTDLGLVAKRGADGMLVWVASLSEAEPVPGVQVKIISDQNQVLASGVSDVNGFFRAPLPQAGEDAPVPFLITASRGEDMAFLHLESFKDDLTGLDISGAPVSPTGYSAFVYGERDIYRPGETVRGAVVVRDSRLATPPPMTLRLARTDPQGRELDAVVLTPDKEGLAAFSFPLPEYALTGPYDCRVLAGESAIGSYRYQVEAFVPDRIAVTVKPDEAAAEPGRDLGFTVRADYLFGAPAADLPVEARVRLKSVPLAPRGFEGYAFGRLDQAFEEREIGNPESRLDVNGTADFSVAVPDGLKPPAGLQAEVLARVREAGGRGVAALATLPVAVYPAWPGLKRLASSAVSPGEPLHLEYVVVDGEGHEAAGRKLTAELVQDRWQTVLRRTPSGSFRYESVRDPLVVESVAVDTGAPRGEVMLTPPEFGSYRVVLVDTESGAASELEFYAGGFGYSPWAVRNPARLELVPDKAEYAPGETARIQVRAPFPGRLLVTAEGRTVLDAQVQAMRGNTAEVLLPVRNEMSPNAYVTAVLVRPAADIEPGSTGRAIGAVPLMVNRDRYRMAVTAEAPATLRPGEPLSVTVIAAPKSEVTVAVVDEGVLQLVNQKTPDPFGFFYAKRALGVDSYDTFALVFPEFEAESPAGGDADLLRNRLLRTEAIRRDKPVAFFSGVLATDASGKATARFPLPDFQGAVRVTAVAAKGVSFGSTQSLVRVKSPLSVTPTVPGFLALGDTAVIPVVVRNDTGAAADVSVAFTATGRMSLTGEGGKTLRLEQGAQSVVLFPVAASQDAEGEAAWAVTATAGAEKTAANGTLYVRSPLPARTAVSSGVLTDPETSVPPPDATTVLPGSLARSVRVGAHPLVRYAGDLEMLLKYPYGCLEQTVSRAFPLVHFGELAKALAPGFFSHASPVSMVQEAVRRVRAMQSAEGGFAMWPRGETIEPWVSLQATHFLVEAGQSGFSVDRGVREAALGYAAGLAHAEPEADAPALLRAAYALHILALAGQADRGSMDYLRSNRLADMGPAARFLLGSAYGLMGDSRAMFACFPEKTAVPDAATESSGNFASPLRDQALVLLALAASPGAEARAAEAAELVATRLAAASPNTQEAGYALTALGAYFARRAASGPFAGEVVLDGTRLGRFDRNATLALQDVPGDAPLVLMLDPGATPGAAFYSVAARYVPALAAFAPHASGLEVKRELFDREGRALAGNATLPQGGLVVMRTMLRSTSGPLANVAVENLLPAGLEVENPRLSGADMPAWMAGEAPTVAAQDVRDDRVVVFVDLSGGEWTTLYTLLRAVSAGEYAWPPVQAQGMYAPERSAAGPLGHVRVSEAR